MEDFHIIWEELNELDINDSYIAEEKNMQFLNEMANVRGRSCKIDDIDFSFYFSKKNSNHSIRLKILWSREKTLRDDDGYIELHGIYKYYSSSNAQHKPKQWEIKGLQYFCRKYKVLFAAVWEMKLAEDDLADYFKGIITFKKLIALFDNISEMDYFKINHCNNLRELERCVRENKIFNIND